METGRKYAVGTVVCILFALTYLMILANSDQPNTRHLYLPPFKKSPAVTVSPESQWEDPGLYHVAYPGNYKFIMDDTQVCKMSTPFVLLVVPIAPADVTTRNIIRSTWGQQEQVFGKLVQTLFFVGIRVEAGAEQLQGQLAKENLQHHDIIQSTFIDSYRNLTIKTMMILEWLSTHCSGAAYAIKVDSDMFLHIPNLVKLLMEPSTSKENYMTGLVWWHSPVLRSPNNKFYMPREVIAEPEYPPYPLGMTYILSLDLAKKILEVSSQIKPIYIEDAYLGMCLKRLQITPTEPPSKDMFLVNPWHPLSSCSLSKVIATTTTSIPQMMSYWRRSKLPLTKC